MSSKYPTINLSEAFATPTSKPLKEKGQGILKVVSPEHPDPLASSFPKPNGSHPRPSAPPEKPKFHPGTSPIASESSESKSRLFDLTFSSRMRDDGETDLKNKHGSPLTAFHTLALHPPAQHLSPASHAMPHSPPRPIPPRNAVPPLLIPGHSNPGPHVAIKKPSRGEPTRHNLAPPRSNNQDRGEGSRLQAGQATAATDPGAGNSASAFSRLQPSSRKDKRKIAERARKAAAELRNAKSKEEEAQRQEKALKKEKLQMLQMKTKSMLQKNLLERFKKESSGDIRLHVMFLS